MAAVLERATNRPPKRPRPTFFPQSLEANERGRLMEYRVADLLLDVDAVKGIMINPKQGIQDQLGRDLTVHLGSGLPIDIVWVQVKSSPRGIREYKKIIGRRLNNQGDTRTPDEWMTANSQILLDGSLDDEIVRAGFYGQLARIQEAHGDIFRRGS